VNVGAVHRGRESGQVVGVTIYGVERMVRGRVKMDGAHISLLKSDLDKVKREGDWDKLGELVVCQLWRLAAKNRLPVAWGLPDLGELGGAGRAELEKYRDEPDRVYPPPGKARVCVAVDLPKPGAVKKTLCSWEQVIQV